MQDRFKFRYLYDNKIYEVAFINFKTNRVYLKIDNLNPVCAALKYKNLMQSTGLKDRNSKLIYEGDIVKIGNGSLNGQILEGVHIVKWHVNKWLHCPSWIFEDMDETHYIEVIGNIYENANMLEG